MVIFYKYVLTLTMCIYKMKNKNNRKTKIHNAIHVRDAGEN
jgi:hypothetical protein